MAESTSWEIRELFAHDGVGDAAVTVCIPLYDYERYVVDALDSVAAQTLSPLALTVVDDGSSDGGALCVLAWMEAHRARFSRLRLLAHPRNEGLARTRNAAIRDAASPFVFLLDADNELHPPCLERLLDALERGKAAFAYSILEQFGMADLVVGCDAWSREHLARGNYVDAMALVKKSAWETVGGYREMRTTGWEDYDFWCRNAEAGLTGILVPQILCRYRVHAESMLRRTTDTLRHHLDVCGEIVDAHPWVHLGAGPGGVETWRTSRHARAIAAVPPLGRLPLPAIDLFASRLQRIHRAARNGAERIRAGVESLRVATERAPVGAAARMRLVRLCIDPTQASRLQKTGASASGRTRLEPEALLGAGAAMVEAEAATPLRIAVYASSQGNFFFREMADHLASGLAASGRFEVTRHDEGPDPSLEVDEHLIVAPHEFFGLGCGQRFRSASFREFRRSSTLFLAEQVGTKHYAFCLPYALEARLVLDLNPSSAAILRDAGVPATFFPLGYLPDLALFEEQPCLTPLQLGGLGLGLGSQIAGSGDGDQLSDRPIDILFNGVFTPRRARFLAANAAFLSKRGSCLLLPTSSRPVTRSVPSVLETREATALARLAKIQLNVHRSTLPYFEWHRLVVRGFWNRSVVVSEPCGGAPGFEPGIHYLEAPLAELPELLRWLLESEEGALEAERVRQAAFERLVERFDARRWAEGLARFYHQSRCGVAH